MLEVLTSKASSQRITPELTPRSIMSFQAGSSLKYVFKNHSKFELKGIRTDLMFRMEGGGLG